MATTLARLALGTLRISLPLLGDKIRMAWSFQPLMMCLPDLGKQRERQVTLGTDILMRGSAPWPARSLCLRVDLGVVADVDLLDVARFRVEAVDGGPVRRDKGLHAGKLSEADYFLVLDLELLDQPHRGDLDDSHQPFLATDGQVPSDRDVTDVGDPLQDDPLARPNPSLPT